MTLVDRARAHARENPEGVAVVDLMGSRRHTYSELEQDALRVAGFLLDSGVAPGDVVAVQLPNRYETVAIALGIFMVGAVINPMLPVYRSRELRYMLTVGQTRVIFLPDSYRGYDHVAMVGAIASEVPELTTRVVVPLEGLPAIPDDWVAFGSVLGRKVTRLPSGLDPLASDVSELIFTSGTEADPKAIMHTEQTTNFSVRAAWSSLSMDADDVVWMPSPIGHSTGFNYGVRMALYHGLKLVLQDRWDGADAARLVASERCTYTLAATTFLRDIVEAAARGAADIASISMFGCGGAPVPPELVRAAAQVGVTVLRLYGSTEALVATWNRRSSPDSKRIETDGRAVDGVEVETWDERGKPVVNEPGEIQTRGPNTCVGFFSDAQRTAATFRPDGWVKSGDLGTIDRDVYLTVVGRKKEIIIRGGLNIAPREIEDLLLQMPGVRAVAVIGLPHSRLGEIGCACIVPDGAVELTLEAVIAHLDAAGLAKYKQPERLELVEAIPMTPTGKVQKFRLIEAISVRTGGTPNGN